jgi:hypothetical protein
LGVKAAAPEAVVRVRSNVGIEDMIVPANVALVIGDATTDTDEERSADRSSTA